MKEWAGGHDEEQQDESNNINKRKSGKLRPKIEEVPETLGEVRKSTLGRGKSKYRSPEAGKHLACSGS